MKDLLISGKSGTMLPITACSITGQFCHDGSWQWQRRMAPASSSSSFDPAGTEARFGGRCERRARSAARQRGAQRANQPQRLERLVEAHADAGRDVAVAVGRHLHVELIVRRPRMIAAQVGGLAARATGETGQSEARRELRLDAAGHQEAVLQPGMLVVDDAQRNDLGFDRVALPADAVEHRGVEIHRANVVLRACEHSHQLVLRAIGVLILVHQEVLELAVVVVANLADTFQQPNRFEQQVMDRAAIPSPWLSGPGSG